MAKKTVLAPCPFCNGTPEIQAEVVWLVRCLDCGAHGPSPIAIDRRDTRAAAAKRWNTRAQPQPPEAPRPAYVTPIKGLRH